MSIPQISGTPVKSFRIANKLNSYTTTNTFLFLWELAVPRPGCRSMDYSHQTDCQELSLKLGRQHGVPISDTLPLVGGLHTYQTDMGRTQTF